MIVEDVRNEHITDELLAFFKPQTVAIIGASQKPNKVGYKILENLIRAGYTGKIIPVNPSADSILGKKCYRSLLEFGDNIDQSVIVVPRAAVMDSVKESIASGAKAITVITAGFKEQDSEGAELEKELAKVAKDLEQSSRKLANRDFRDKAAPEIIVKEEGKLKSFQEKFSALEGALKKLKEVTV